MTTRLTPRALVSWLLCGCAALIAVSCGVDNSLVGGHCAPGYVACGSRCVPRTSCVSLQDASRTASDAAVDGTQPDSAFAETGSESDEGPDQGVGPDDATSGDADATPDDGSTDTGGEEEASALEAAVSDGGPDSSDASSVFDGSDADAGVDAEAGGDAIANPDASTDDGEAGNPCTPPLVFCGGLCIDVSADPLNCGACNVVCASQLCSGSRCSGAASGGIVYVGHDYTTTLPGTAQARVLSNAVFIPQANPLQVMSYERYASPSAISRVNSILTNVASQIGRTLGIHHTTSDGDIPAQLRLPDFDVLLVHDQPTAPDGALATLGTSWAVTLRTFTLGGGVVVVLDGGTGIQQMPAFATGTGLLAVDTNSPVAVATPLLVTSRVDVVGIGVISPYGAGQSTVSVTTEPNGGNVVYVVEARSDAGSGSPVVVHKAF
jgi:hypothetical protein